MKLLASIIAALLGLLTCLAVLLVPEPKEQGRLPMVWVSDNNPMRQDQIRAFHEQFPDYFLQLDPIGKNRRDKVLLQCASGVGPDIYDCNLGKDVQVFVEAGVAYDVTAHAKRLGFSVDDNVWPALRRELAFGGKQYAYPCNAGTNILIYNKNVFDEFGVPYPHSDLTWEEFFALAKRVTHVDRKNPQHTIFGVTRLFWNQFFYSMRGEYFNEDGTELLILSDTMHKAFQLYHDILYKHKIATTKVAMDNMMSQGGWGAGSSNRNNLFAEGRFAMIVVGKWSLISFRRAYVDQLRKFRKWAADPDRDPGKKPVLLRLGACRLPHFRGMPCTYQVTTRAAAVNNISDKRDHAIHFLEYLAGPEYSRILNAGVDNLPGNPAYAWLGVEEKYPDLAEKQMHQVTIESIQYGYTPSHSPFLLTYDVIRILSDQQNRIESSETIPIHDVLQYAQDELEKIMRKNLRRSPSLRQQYKLLKEKRSRIASSLSDPADPAQSP